MDFSKLGKARKSSEPSTLLELFDQLDRKASHNSLRPVQIEALNGLQAQIAERDVLLKVSTGSGKTVVGLVFAEFMRRRYQGEPVVYLCPTLQLVDQVLQGAAAIGVNAAAYPSEGLPLDGFAGKSVLVCTYDRLFNARSTFNSRRIVPSTLILDDVHAGTDRIRQKYTVSVPAAAYDRIRGIFRPICEASDPAIWRGIENNEHDARYEVPSWLWIPHAETVAKLLNPLNEDDALFDWGNIARYAEYARLCITGVTAELSLPVAAVEENAAYSSPKHRLFMSASIKDGSSALKDLALDPSALSRIVEPSGDRGAGERMILPVALIDPDLSKIVIATLCNSASAAANVVVLTSSKRQAEIWAKQGAAFRQGAEVDRTIAELRSTPRGKYVVFAQRFDGVDLPDDACRVLVVDGTPTGERICDQIDADRLRNSPGHNSRTVNRFEQALGRAVRSSADYAVILLVGTDIASFIGRKDVRDALEAHTREQIELGQDLATQLKQNTGTSLKAIQEAIKALIAREDSWKEAHRERMAGVAKSTRPGGDLTVTERSARAERVAWLEAKARNHQKAIEVLEQAINEPTLHSAQRAELLVRAAGYAHRVDPARALSLYQSAFHLNSLLPRPVEVVDRKLQQIKKQSLAIRDYLHGFTSANAAVAKLEEIRARLAYSGDAEIVEEALMQLGEILGATSSRPERETGRGPDVLWLFDSNAFCIEAKNEKTAPIFKRDAQQLMLSKQWCVDHTNLVEAAIVPVFATNQVAADRLEDISFGPRFITEAIIQEVVGRLRTLLTALSYDGPLFNDAATIDRKLKENALRGQDITGLLRKLKGC
jgi:tetratricopeptide (TPR) repeat protein